MPTTPKMGLRYPAATDAPDGPGALYNLATDVDNAVQVNSVEPYVNLSTGVTYDNTAGLNRVTIFGNLRIVHVSLFRSANDAVLGYGFAQMNAGHRPAAPVTAGCIVYDAGASLVGIASIGVDGGISITQVVGNINNDNAYGGLRATFTYPVA